MNSSTTFLVAELVVLFLGVAFAVELLQRRLGPDRLQAWMGGPPIIAALKGISIGFITPFCTYSAIPLLIGLRRAGVPTAGYIAFIVAAPVLDPVLFGALVIIVGLDVAVTYLAVAFAAAMSLALVAERVGIDRHLKPIPSSAARTRELAVVPAGAAVGEPLRETEAVAEPWRGLRTESRQAARSAALLFRSFGPLLVVGVGIGLAIEAFVSPDTAARVTGDNSAFAIPIAAALGTPLYFSTELFVPIADALHAAGVGTGAIVALTISGAGANLPEFVILTKLASARLVAIFFAYVFAVATIGGLIAQTISG